jgi:hypothetical protein
LPRGPAGLLLLLRCAMCRMLAVSVGLLLLAGCGSSRPQSGVVTGKITYKGQPVNGASLMLYPTKPGEGAGVTIPVDQEGNFRAADVPLGEYKVVVEGAREQSNIPPGPANMTPEEKEKRKELMEKMKTKATIPFPSKYTNEKTTDLTCTVNKGEQTVNLELKD